MDNKQIEQALNDIKELKLTVDNKLKRLKPFFISKGFLRSVFISFILMCVLTILIFISDNIYQGYNSYPLLMKILIVLIYSFSFIQIAIVKLSLFYRKDEFDIRDVLTWKSYKSSILKMGFAYTLSIILYFIIESKIHIPGLLLPVFLITYGIIIMSYSSILALKELEISGYFVIAQGLVTLIFIKSQILLWTTANITLTLLFIYLALLIPSKRHSK